MNVYRVTTYIEYKWESFALVYKDGEFVDQDSADFVAEEYSRGHSFFTYMSDTVDSLSSCCFDGKTPVMYVAPENINSDKKEFIYEAIEDAYDKYNDKTVQVYQETIDKSKETCIGTWVNAKFVKAEAIQEIQIYLQPDGFTIAEWKDVMRVTPDHIFPVKTKNGIIEKYAYLLETGDELVFEDAQYKDERVDNVEGEQKLIYRTISKVVTENFDKPKSYYCFKIEDENIQPYFLLPNGCITHNCRLKNKIQTKEFNFTNGNLGINLGPLCA